MDLTEIEFMNDDLEPREINEKIKELRDALIDNVTSHTAGLPIKNFYDGNSSASYLFTTLTLLPHTLF